METDITSSQGNKKSTKILSGWAVASRYLNQGLLVYGAKLCPLHPDIQRSICIIHNEKRIFVNSNTLSK